MNGDCKVHENLNVIVSNPTQNCFRTEDMRRSISAYSRDLEDEDLEDLLSLSRDLDPKNGIHSICRHERFHYPHLLCECKVSAGRVCYLVVLSSGTKIKGEKFVMKMDDSPLKYTFDLDMLVFYTHNCDTKILKGAFPH